MPISRAKRYLVYKEIIADVISQRTGSCRTWRLLSIWVFMIASSQRLARNTKKCQKRHIFYFDGKRKMAEEQENGATSGGLTAQQKSNAVAEAIIALKNALAKEEGFNRDQEGHEDKWNKIISLATLFFVICTTTGIVYQDYVLHSSDEAAHQSATAAINAAKESKRSADAAIKQSEIATKQAEASDKAAAQAQRAWVGPRDAHLESKPVVGRENKVLIQYQNTGREPALGFVFGGNVFVEGQTEDANGTGLKKILDYLQQCVAEPSRDLAGVVFPASGLAGGATLSASIDGRLIDDDFVAGKKLLIVQGCFAYQTEGITRHSAFCFFYKADQIDFSHLGICYSGNLAD